MVNLPARASLMATSALLVLGWAVPLQAQDSSEAATGDPAEVSDDQNGNVIIVTARRREESILDVPVSVTAVGASEIELRGAKNLESLTGSVPGLFIGPNRTAGEQGDKSFTIRGIGSGSLQASTVAVYLDDTPITFGESSPDLRLIDVARIEILRGPQGTLFGASSMGGAIKYVSPEADFSAFGGSGKGELSLQRYGGTSYEGQGVVTGPLVPDRLALRLSGFYRHDAGYIDLRDETDGSVVRPNIGQSDAFGGRAALTARLGEQVDATLSVIFQDEQDDGSNIFFSTRGTTPSTPMPPRSRVQRQGSFRKDRVILPNLTVNADFGFATLTSSSSYVNRRLKIGADLSYFIQKALGLPDPSTLAVQNLEFRDFEGFVQEMRLASNADVPLRWQIGGYYRRTTENRPQFIPSNLAQVVPPLAPFVLDGGSVFTRTLDTRRRQWAVFGEASYTIADTVTLTAGLRYTELRQQIDRDAAGIFNGNVRTGFSLSSKETPVTPKFSVQYKPSEQLMVYATAAKGFREGAPNPSVPTGLAACANALAALGRTDAPDSFSTDSLWSYEAGAKFQTSDRALRVSGAVYQIDWSRIQTAINLAAPCSFSYTDNLGSARSRGFELEATLRPSDRFNVDIAVAHTDARLAEDLITGANAAGPIVAAPRGTRLPDAPAWTVFAATSYRFPLLAGWDGLLRAEVQHVSDTRRNLGTSASERLALVQDAYELVNLRMGLSSANTDVQLFVNNLFDDDTVLYQSYSRFAPGNGFEGTQVQPRVIGISVKQSF